MAQIDATDKRIEAQKRAFIEQFGTSSGTVSDICPKVGVSRETFYRWRKEDREFEREVESARMTLNDAVEDKLLRKIFVENDSASIRFYLTHRHPNYHPKGWNISPRNSDMTFDDFLGKER